MYVLILEDDELVGDLLETVVAGAYPGAVIRLFTQVQSAISNWQKKPADLVIADWNLPDGSGLELIRAVRQTSRDVPVLMISGRADRDSILAAAHLGISGYVSKPFQVDMLHKRLLELLPAPIDLDGTFSTLEEKMEAACNSAIQLPGEIDTAALLELVEKRDELDAVTLAEHWKTDPALSAKMLDVANSASFRRSGTSVKTLREAISTIGIAMALNQAMALSLDIAGKLSCKRLAERAQQEQEQALRVAEVASGLARRIGDAPAPYYTAGLLSRAGELAALKILQNQCDESGEQPEAEQIDSAIAYWAEKLGNRIKVQWRLPLDLRELIGAVYFVSRGNVSQSKLVMRAAALLAAGQADDPECITLLRRLGIEHKEDRRDAT
ncbi:HDOD domain-containing protein [Marinobacter sp. DY40_1A1]|uniref:HDOD domain-containing protein n=1 Tax=Marinobacter sp. DY40_1A1 TaxID=2583229 RepID=UPI001907AC80|nr:HDOD domain-containing protein [Marinobacter sp. DY40_1A1]MBK1886467.1 HDOD domain-containing protein [Marinobacter sp. DY40_1A1]